MKPLILALFLLHIISINSPAQFQEALPFMTYQTSLPLIGAGDIGAAKQNKDPIGYYLNPAILGYTSQNNHASIFYMPNEVDLMPSNDFDLTMNTYGFNIGYNFSDLGLPISIGFGYIHHKFSFGMFSYTGPDSPEIIGEFESYDSYDAYSIGIGYDYYLLFNLGFSIKPYESVLGYSVENDDFWKAEGTAFDFGAMIITPISKLFFDDTKIELSSTTHIRPLVNFTIGYSQTNIGDEIVYVDEAQSDPLSRTARLGYTIDFGFDTYIEKNKVNLITYSFTAEAEDLLIDREDSPNFGYQEFLGYQSFLGDININNHLIQLKGDEKVVVHKGHTINLFETLTITKGNYHGKYYPEEGIKTNGYGLSSEGLFKFLSYSANSQVLNYIAKHFVIEYYDVNLFYDSPNETNMQGLSLNMNNIEL